MKSIFKALWPYVYPLGMVIFLMVLYTYLEKKIPKPFAAGISVIVVGFLFFFILEILT